MLSPLPWWHEVDKLHRADFGYEVRLKNQGVFAVTSPNFTDWNRRGDRPMAITGGP
jgi:hypothetical protein